MLTQAQRNRHAVVANLSTMTLVLIVALVPSAILSSLFGEARVGLGEAKHGPAEDVALAFVALYVALAAFCLASPLQRLLGLDARRSAIALLADDDDRAEEGLPPAPKDTTLKRMSLVAVLLPFALTALVGVANLVIIMGYGH